MRSTWILALACVAGWIVGCSSETSSVGGYHHALTGEACEPDMESMVLISQPRDDDGRRGRGGHRSPTGIPGDNLDDEHSGKVDCYFDGDSGQGNDWKNCQPPGCDAYGCCADGPSLPDPDQDGDIDESSEDETDRDEGTDERHRDCDKDEEEEVEPDAGTEAPLPDPII